VAATVCIVADTLGYPTGAGHLWAYLNWALGLRSIGCEVIWMEPGEHAADDGALAGLAERLGAFGIDKICLAGDVPDGAEVDARLVTLEQASGADLLLNLSYAVSAALLARFPRSALLDIDPGLSQTWFADGDIPLGAYDVYMTIGEGVAAGTAAVPDCGVRWLYTPPCASLEAWSNAPPPAGGAYTTLAHWWEGGTLVQGGEVIDNSKRAGFLPYLGVPRAAGVSMELAISVEDLEDDAELLRRHGWSFADPARAAGTPERYRAFIERSRGEFSCAKPAYVRLRTGWISDRTVCYLATGRPAIVQDTGPCRMLDEAQGAGIFRFRDPAGAAAALAQVEQDYARQCALARQLAEEAFDARRAAGRLLELCL
jgi:hypothetical protein